MGERTEWTARGGRTVEVDYPAPARTVVLTVTVDRLEEITVLAGGADGTELHRGKGAWSVLVPPARQEELRRITVTGPRRWQLRLHDPAEAAELTGRVTGSGPRVLVHPGGTVLVDVTHRSSANDAQLFRLVRPTADGDREVLATGDRVGKLYRSDNWTLLLEGPQLLVVEQGEEWSLTGRPADLPPSTETVRHGIGDRREVFAWPDGTGPALLEVETADGVLLGLEDHAGRSLAFVHAMAKNGVQRVLVRADPDRRALGPFRAEVTRGRRAWRLELLPVEDARELVGRADGTGHDVLAYTGPPAVLRAWSLADKASSVTVEAGGRRIATRYGSPEEWGGAIPVGGPPEPGEPEQVRVESSGRWRLEVVPLAAVPVFDGRLSGLGAEVVRWAGPPGRLTVRTGRWHGGLAEATVLDERLNPLGATSTFGRRRHVPVELPSGCLVAVQTWGLKGRWRLAVR
ncbi:hypothetical protein [Streptomyces sp. NRRL S-495]|uniref:hypothetical protein n=1 Tax=Streptomyces sp. NRRL S-495 TaxID=1609133 RepID=UPI0013316BDC|nr:hypothetical protein [Streptomyces sp. NRRL S-495]